MLQHVRRLFQAEKAGHTGSLDPLATGLLPICLGEATKLSGLLLDADKRYRVRAAVGARTSTGDAEGEVIARSDPAGLDAGAIRALISSFTGPILQRPPMHSALKHQGERLYEIARRGEEVDRPERPVTILALELLSAGPGWFELDVRCSKGTYIRSLVEDLAAAAGACAHVAALRRTGAGPFGDAMVTPEALEALALQGLAALDAVLLPPLAGLQGWPRVAVEPAQASRLAQGQAVPAPGGTAAGEVAVVDSGPRLLGLAEVTADGLLRPRRWFRTDGEGP